MAFNPNEHMMKLKGRDYLQVMWRLVWFREEHADWSIQTACLEHDAEHAIFAATIADETGRELATGHGSESKKDFMDFLEKAETKAVGRALAMLGYGTQFAPDDMDEGERIVDSPVAREAQKARAAKSKEAEPEIDMTSYCDKCGKPVTDAQGRDGIVTAYDIVRKSKRDFFKTLCYECYVKEYRAQKKNG